MNRVLKPTNRKTAPPMVHREFMTLLSVLLLFGRNIVAVGWLVFLPGGRLRRCGAEVGTIVCLRLRSSLFLFFGVFIDAF